MERGPARILRRAAPQNKGGRLLGPDQNLIDKAQAYLYFNLTLFSGAHLYITHPPRSPRLRGLPQRFCAVYFIL